MRGKKKHKTRAGGRPKTKGIHINSGGVKATMRVGDNKVESDYAASDELHTASESDAKHIGVRKRDKFPSFNADRDMKDPIFAIKILFITKKEFKEACKQWGIKHRF